MFGFLKDKLKGALGKFSKEVEKDATVEKKEVIIEKETPKKIEPKTNTQKEKIQEKPVLKESKELNKEVKPAQKIEEKPIVKPVVKEEPKQEKKEEKKGFFAKIFGRKEVEEIIEEKEEILEELEKPQEIIEVEKPKKKTQEKITIKTSKPVKEEIKKAFSDETTKIKPAISKVQEKTILVNKKIEVPEYVPDYHTHDEHGNHIHSHTSNHAHTHEDMHSHSHDRVHPHIHEGTHVHEHKHEKIVETKTVPIKQEKPVIKEIKKEIPQVEKKEVIIEKETPKEEKKGFFTKITETFTKFHLSEEKFEELFWELEVVMLENNVAVEVIEKIKQDMKKELMSGKISRNGVEEIILQTLKKSIIELFNIEKINLIEKIQEKKKTGMPYVITIIGVNGSGKTTSIAKLTHMLQKKGFSVVLAASDTFRAAAIQQLEEHANNLNAKLIKHDYNSDPAAVGFDAIKYAQAKNVDVVIIDTAGRLHSNTNLMRELEKVVRICKPDIKIFVGESITGNDCVEQAKEFDKVAGIDAIILAKADVDEKGGAAISVSYVTGKPILYLGVGQTYDDLKEFDSELIIRSLEL